MNTDFLATLNDAQRAAATHAGSNLAIVAGAGAGKTGTLIRRVAWLTQQGVPLERILAVTFTNKAANEMRTRLEGLGIVARGRQWLGTFHGLGARFLRQHHDLAGLPAQFNILDQSDSERLLKRLADQYDWVTLGLVPKDVGHWIARRKDEGLTPAQCVNRGDEAELAMAYKVYQAELDRMGACDFGDLLLRPYVLLRDHPAVLERFAQQFGHILVDEFQDTNDVQYDWLALVSDHGRRCPVTVVGDMDQSIYSWRGAQMTNVLRFGDEFQATTLKLEQNYRSTGHILKAANAVVANNRQRIDKTLWTDQGDGVPVRVALLGDGRDEAEWIAARIQASIEQGKAPKEFAVLYRLSAMSRQIEDSLLRRRVPYRVHGGVRFFDRTEIKDALAHLAVLNRLDNDLALERALAAPPKGIGSTAIANAQAWASAHHGSLAQGLTTAADNGTLTTKAAAAWRTWADQWREAGKLASLTAKVRWCVEHTGLLDRARQNDKDEGTDRAENLGELISMAQEFEQEQSGTPAELLQEFLELTALVPDAQVEAQPEGVTLMTVHAAKGLEFPFVFVTGCEESVFPSGQSLADPDRLEEERRLAYVAMTRAERRLCMTCALRRQLWGRWQDQLPSRFLKEIPDEHRDIDRASVVADLDDTAPRPLPGRLTPIRATGQRPGGPYKGKGKPTGRGTYR